jgi:putative heme-binding domain-containing protein
MRATGVLADRGDEAAGALTEALEDRAGPGAEIHGLWALERLGALADDRLAQAAGHPDRSVRTHAMRILTDRPTLGDADRARVVDALSRDADPNVRRAAAQALGAHPGPENLSPLVDARKAADDADTHYVHVLRMALRDQLRGDAAWRALGREGAWDEASLRILADAANGVADAEAARFQLGYLAGHAESPENLLRYEEHIARFGDPDLDRRLVAFARSQRADDPAFAAAQVRAIHRGLQGRGAPLLDELRGWAVELTRGLIATDDDGRVALGAELAGEFRLAEARDALAGLAGSKAAPEGRRLGAINALATIAPDLAVEPLAAILGDPAESIGLRERAAALLGEGGRPEGKEELAESLTAAPARLQAPIALALAGDRPGAERLLDLIAGGKASPRLLQAPPVEIRLRQLGVPDLAARMESLTRELPPADQVIAERIAARQAGFAAATGASAERGRAVFTKSCAACHRIGDEGGRVGPQLDGIGARGADRLMEDILDPNRNVDQAFRASTLALDDGRVLTGLVLSDEGEVVVLADSQGKEVRVPKSSVEDRKVAPLSPMPADLAEQIDEKDFYDLIAFLASRREPAEGD